MTPPDAPPPSPTGGASGHADPTRPTSGNEAFEPPLSSTEHTIAVHGFHFIERAFLILVTILTLGGAVSELIGIWHAQTITLADILLMFLYTEVIGMIAVFYAGGRTTFVYPIFIAITALARLIVLQGKDMAPENIVFEAVAILLLTLAALVLERARKA